MIYLEALWKYMQISSPYLLLGMFVSGLMRAFISVETVKRQLGKNSFINVLKGALFGIPLPLCSCAVIPAAATLRKSGGGNGATSSFLIATPESGIDSIAMTYGLMDLPMTLLRPIAAFFSAIIAGVLQNILNDWEYKEKVEEKKSCCGSSKKKENRFLAGLKFSFTDLLEDMVLWLTIGIALGALIDVMVPADAMAFFGGLSGRLMILFVGIPLYICASASTPIAASLMLKGMSPGSALILLLVGPATNMSNIVILQKYIGKKGVMINVFSIAFVALFMSYLTDLIYEKYQLPMDFKLSHIHEDHISLFATACAYLMTSLMLKAIYAKYWKKR